MAKRKGRSRPAARSRATSSRTTKAARTTRRAKRRASTQPTAARAGTRRRARQIAVATGPIVDLKQVWTTVRPRLPAEFRVHVRRPDDLLVFDLLFDNLKVEPGVVPRLVKKNPSATAALVVEFQPQSFGEQAFLEVSGSEPGAEDEPESEVSDHDDYPPKNNLPSVDEVVPPLPGAKIRMAGRSRVGFVMPPAIAGLDYTLAEVLRAMRTWPMRLDYTAAPEPRGVLRPRPDLSEKLDFNRDWLKAITSSQSWTAMSELVSSTLAAMGTRGLDALVDAAARRLSSRASDGLMAGDRQLNAVLTDALRSEVNAIVARQPRLGVEGGRELVTAAISMAATAGLSASGSSFDFSLGTIPLIPFLPILMTPHEPGPGVTALELPYRVILSPLTPARWLHRDDTFESSGRTELWHTRLTTAANDFGPDAPAKVRAIWTPDYDSWEPQFGIDEFLPLLEPPPKPFRMSLDPLDRAMLVRLMANFTDTVPFGRPYQPRASRARKLQLSALGGSLDVEGNWKERPVDVDLEQWRHIASLGRDQYARVVYTGFLCALPHAASLIKVTERKFESLGADIRQQRVAVLRQSFYIVTRERIKEYSGQNHKFGGRNFPFKHVEILTPVTPKLIDPADKLCRLEKAAGDPEIYGGKVVQRMVFWPMVPSAGGGAKDFPFEVAYTDICDQRKPTATPLLFVGQAANNTKDEAIRKAYNKSAPSKRTGDLAGATICYAPFTAGDKGDPRLPTDSLTLAAGALRDGVHFPLDPNYYPEIDRAFVGIRPVQKLLNKPGATAKVTYPDVYKQHGFGEQDPAQNKGKLFLQLVDQLLPLEFGESSEKAKSDGLGALAAPQMVIQGLSRTMGPVAAKPPADPSKPEDVEKALGNIIGDSFHPIDFFKDARILGGIYLADILAPMTPTLVNADVPKMLSRDLADAVETSFTWDTEIATPDPLNLLLPKADSSKPNTRLKMEAVTRTPFKNPADVQFEACAEMMNFKVNLFGFVIIWFERLQFSSKKGQKPDVVVQLRQGNDAVQFGGALEFVNQLRDIIPSNGFSDPPAITVTPSGIQAGYSLTLPSIGVGIFTLSGVSLGAGFTLPFDSTPAQVRFNFSDREHTFSLTVSMLGGGGFFAIGISSAGVNEIEAALEFGAAVAIDLGVASGGVEIKAGVYFHWLEPQPDKGSIDLAGYVRLHGELSVLGLISASLTFNLQLTYHKDSSRTVVWGEATLIVEVEVLLFSGEVTVRCRKEFGGSENADPKFIDLVPDQATWEEYCAAFAQEAA